MTKPAFQMLAASIFVAVSCSKQKETAETGSIDSLTRAIENSQKAHDYDALVPFFHRDGEPEEISKKIGPMLRGIWENEKLVLGVLSVKPVGEHTPPMDLPGKLDGRPMEYLVGPTHWILAPLATPEGQNPALKFNLSLPAAVVDGKWKLIGTRFAED